MRHEDNVSNYIVILFFIYNDKIKKARLISQ